MYKEGNREMRITDAELSLIKMTFADNDALLKVLRKVFLPEINATTPIGQQVDLWMTVGIENMSPEDALITIKARNQVIQHVEMRLMELKMLAGIKEETVEQTKERLKKDSSK